MISKLTRKKFKNTVSSDSKKWTGCWSSMRNCDILIRNIGPADNCFRMTRHSYLEVRVFRCSILTCTIFHHLTCGNVNTCSIPVYPLSCGVPAKWCTTQPQGYIQTGIPYVYTHYMNWKMVVHQNVISASVFFVNKTKQNKTLLLLSSHAFTDVGIWL